MRLRSGSPSILHDEMAAFDRQLEARRALCAQRCTINGRPASLGGAAQPFARVYDLESGLSAEWAWPTAEEIMAKGGHFRSELLSAG